MKIFDAHISGSLSVSASAEISGNLNVLGTINGSVSGNTTSADTASFAPKYTLTSSFQAFTSSYTTGSFTGSFIGSGTGLYNIPASGITGLNLSQIAEGSSTASISSTDGLRVNTNTEITGALTATGQISGSFKGDGTNLYNIPASGVTGLNLTRIADGVATASISNANGLRVNSNTEITGALTISGSISLNGVPVGTGKLDETTFNSYTSSNDSTNSTQSSRLTSIESATGSLNTFTSSIDTTIKNKLNTETVISGSVQVLITGTTGYSTFSSSVSTSIGSLSSSVATTTSGLSSSIDSLSSSVATTTLNLKNRVDLIETSTGSLNTFTSSINTTIKTKLDTESVISGSVQILITGTTGYSTFSSSIATTTSGLSSSIGSLSSSIATTDSNQDGKLTSLESYTGSNNTVIGTLQTSTSSLNTFSSSANGRLTALETTTSSLNSYTSSNTTNINAIHTSTGSLNTFTSSFNTAIGLSGADVTVKGNLTISGTTTTVNSTTVEIGDNIIQLNGTGATNAGLVVRDATAPNTVSGSLLWDTTNDNWIAGALGSEQRLVRETEFNNAVTRIGNVETSTGSVNSFTSSINTTIKSKLNTDTVMSGSYLGTATTANLSENASYLYYTDDRVKTKLNAEGVVSGSAQITLSSTTGYGSVINQALLTTSTPTFSTVSATTFTGALSGNATTATALTSMNISQFTNNSAYLTGITSGNVTTALGYTPYNATNPSGYITGYTETDTLATVTARGASTSTAILINNSLSVNGGTVNLATYTSSEARIADSSIHLMKTSAAGIFEAVRAMNADTTAGTTVRLVAAATSDPFNNTNGGKVFIDAVRTSTNMDLVFSLNDVAGAAPVERVRFTGAGNIIATGTISASNYSGTHTGASSGTNTGDETLARVNALAITTVGTITSGTWNGSAIGNAYLANSSFNIGTTSISLGRASASQTLTGISIDGNAATVTNFSGTHSGTSSGTNTGDQTNISGTAASETLATVTARGATSSQVITLSGTANSYSGHHYFIAYDATGNHYPHYQNGSSNVGAIVNTRVYTGSGGSWRLFVLNGQTAAISWDGYTIYHSGNIPTWNQSTTGNAATVTNATFYRQFTVRDDRSDGNDYSLANRPTGLYAITSTGSNGPGSTYSSLIHVANGTDVAFQIAGGYTSDSMYFRGTSALQSGSGYTAWRTVIHSGNYGSYALPLGGGAMTGNITFTNTSSLGTQDVGGTAWFRPRDTSNNLHIYTSSGGIFLDTNSTHYFRNVAGTNRLVIDTSGNATLTGVFTENSSLRYKKDIETIKYGLDKVLQMRGVTYVRKDSEVKEIGVIAEEMNEILPDIVLKNEEGQVDSVSYGRLSALFIEAIKELKQEINEQNLIISELKSKLDQ